jgi:predicted RNA-binding Zn-ribbon protein involved in translation (DUF1610 family)
MLSRFEVKCPNCGYVKKMKNIHQGYVYQCEKCNQEFVLSYRDVTRVK